MSNHFNIDAIDLPVWIQSLNLQSSQIYEKDTSLHTTLKCLKTHVRKANTGPFTSGTSRINDQKKVKVAIMESLGADRPHKLWNSPDKYLPFVVPSGPKTRQLIAGTQILITITKDCFVGPLCQIPPHPNPIKRAIKHLPENPEGERSLLNEHMGRIPWNSPPFLSLA